MGQKWLRYMKKEVDEDDAIAEVEIEIEYTDGTKRKWTFVGDNDPIVEDGDDEEDEEDDLENQG